LTYIRIYANISFKELEVIENKNKTVKLFCRVNGKEPFVDWLKSLDKITKRIIENRVVRLLIGNYGDHKRINRDIFELRVATGPGYRVYFAEENNEIIILLCGGDKSTQSKDIEKATNYYNIYRSNKNEKL
jgi:putative addiction module killer protein